MQNALNKNLLYFLNINFLLRSREILLCFLCMELYINLLRFVNIEIIILKVKRLWSSFKKLFKKVLLLNYNLVFTIHKDLHVHFKPKYYYSLDSNMSKISER